MLRTEADACRAVGRDRRDRHPRGHPAQMAAAVLSPFESHRQRMLDEAAEDNEHVSTLLHCDWPPPCVAAAEPTLSRAAAPYPHGSLLTASCQAGVACSEMLEARRLARAAKVTSAQQRGIAIERVVSAVSSRTSVSALSSDDTLDLLIDAILATEVDCDEEVQTAW